MTSPPPPDPGHPHAHPEPVDPDIDFDGATPAAGLGPVVAVIAVGGALGACARYGAGLLWPTPEHAFPWTTLLVNALGCAIIGAFLVVVTEIRETHRLVRPFVGTGILGGFTTFSTYAVDIERLVRDGRTGIAAAYGAATLAIALVCVWAAATATRRFAVRAAGLRSAAGDGS